MMKSDWSDSQYWISTLLVLLTLPILLVLLLTNKNATIETISRCVVFRHPWQVLSSSKIKFNENDIIVKLLWTLLAAILLGVIFGDRRLIRRNFSKPFARGQGTGERESIRDSRASQERQEVDFVKDDEDALKVARIVRVMDSVSGVDDGMAFPPLILSPTLLQQVAQHVLPCKLWDYQWKRLYSLSRDGDSFTTLVNAIRNVPVTLFVIRTQKKGAILGALADTQWRIHEGPIQFHGGPDCRLFRVVPEYNNIHSSKVECFRWTGINRNCQLIDVTKQRIAFGCSTSLNDHHDGIFGLTLERDLLQGTTSKCDTFHNPLLCDELRFAIVELEVFGFKMW